MLAYLKIIEDELIDMFSTSSINRKINNANYKGYVYDKLKKELNSGDTSRAEAILDSLKFKKQEKPRETIAEVIKLIHRRKAGTGIKLFTSNKILTRLPVLFSTDKSWK